MQNRFDRNRRFNPSKRRQGEGNWTQVILPWLAAPLPFSFKGLGKDRDTRHPGDLRRVDSGGWPGSHSYQTEDGGRISPFDYRAVMQ